MHYNSERPNTFPIMHSYHTKTNHILENLNTVVLLLNSDLRIIYINPAAEMFLSLSLDRIFNRTIDSIFNHNETLNHLKNACHSGRTFTQREVNLYFNQQETIVDLSITPILAKTKTKEIILELNPQDRYLQISKEEMLFSQQQVSRELLRSMAHEVKNPLGGIRGAAQLLEQEFDANAFELKEYTKVIINEADRLKNLVDRMMGPKTKSNKNWVNIHAITEHVRNLMNNDHDISIPTFFDYDPSIPEIYADSEQLIQAILNLTRNAAQSINECKQCSEKKITLKTRVKRHYTIASTFYSLVLKLDIIDTGPGIKAELFEHIFMPLITGRATGTGLGLSIAQSLVNENKGLIECSSTPGNTIFTVLLPITSKSIIKKDQL